MSGIPRKKTCSKCGRSLSLKEFGRVSITRQAQWQQRGWETYAAECKWCVRQRAMNYKIHNREKVLASTRSCNKIKNDIIKEYVFLAYGGFVCACCGETEKSFLSLDHIDNDGAAWRRERFGNRAAAGSHTYKWLYKNKCPRGFQVLCMNCNHGKRMNKGVCPHQVTCNDYPVMGVEASASKRSAPNASSDEEIVSSTAKSAAVH